MERLTALRLLAGPAPALPSFTPVFERQRLADAAKDVGRVVQGPYGTYLPAPRAAPRPAQPSVLQATGGFAQVVGMDLVMPDAGGVTRDPITGLVVEKVQTTVSTAMSGQLGLHVPPRPEQVRKPSTPAAAAIRPTAPPVSLWGALHPRPRGLPVQKRPRSPSPAGADTSSSRTDGGSLESHRDSPHGSWGLPDSDTDHPASDSDSDRAEVGPTGLPPPSPAAPTGLVPYMPAEGSPGAVLEELDVDAVQVVVPAGCLVDMCPTLWSFWNPRQDGGQALAARSGYGFLILTSPWKVRIPQVLRQPFTVAMHTATGLCHCPDTTDASQGGFTIATEVLLDVLGAIGCEDVWVEAYGMKCRQSAAIKILHSLGVRDDAPTPRPLMLDAGRLHNPDLQDTIVLFQVAVVGEDGRVVEEGDDGQEVPNPLLINESHRPVGSVRYSVYPSMGVLGRFTQGSVTIDMVGVCVAPPPMPRSRRSAP